MSEQTCPQDESLFKAIDGGHLHWSDFRRDVLFPFGILMADAPLNEQLPPDILSFLQRQVETATPSTNHGNERREQPLAGQGFSANSTVFPPYILPPLSRSTKLQRCQSPNMSREGLPRRNISKQDSLFELPHSKPLFASSFAYEIFTENEHKALPSFAVPAGTNIDFTNGRVVPGRLMPFPFLVFEHCPGSRDDDIESVLNMCAVSGTQCLNGIQEMFRRGSQQMFQTCLFAFSCAINDNLAVIVSHTYDKKGQYTTSALCRFELQKADHFQSFQIWIQAIEEWASKKLLVSLKACLAQVLRSGTTPPASPMPSLTLSIDTFQGSMPSLMRALRGTYSEIKWHAQEEAETPIMSSIATCGTPWEGRRLQSLALVTDDPAATHLSLMTRRRQNSGSVLAPIHTKSQNTYAPVRPSPLSPHYTNSPDIDWGSYSPCRPCTLSPCTPAPDMPWSAKSPMLVLQKRVEVAMSEIQELRCQMEILQKELSAKCKMLDGQAPKINPQVLSTDKTSESMQTVTCSERLMNVLCKTLLNTTRSRRGRYISHMSQLAMLILVALIVVQALGYHLSLLAEAVLKTGVDDASTAIVETFKGGLFLSARSCASIPGEKSV